MLKSGKFPKGGKANLHSQRNARFQPPNPQQNRKRSRSPYAFKDPTPLTRRPVSPLQNPFGTHSKRKSVLFELKRKNSGGVDLKKLELGKKTPQVSSINLNAPGGFKSGTPHLQSRAFGVTLFNERLPVEDARLEPPGSPLEQLELGLRRVAGQQKIR